MNIIINGKGEDRTMEFKSVFHSETLTTKYKHGLLSWIEFLSQLGKLWRFIWNAVFIWNDYSINYVYLYGEKMSWNEYKHLPKRQKYR